MKISVEHRFLFVHIQRTAGSSIAAALAPFCIDERRRYPGKALAKLGLVSDWTRLDYGKHLTLRAAERRIPGNVFAGLFKFAVVRNPWDRLVSRYHHRIQRPGRGKRDAGGFSDYLRREAARIGIRPGATQRDMLLGADGTIGTDRVLRFENLAADWTELVGQLEIDAATALPRWNRSDHDDWRNCYNDEDAAWVARHWAADIEAFGYTFDAKSV